MKKGFTKYLSCIILVVICIALATVFCVHASDAFRGADDKGDDTGNDTSSQTEENEVPKRVISIGGTVLSEYLYDSSLRCEWISQKNEGEKTVYLAVELYLDTPNTITNARGGRLVVNGEETELFVGTVIGKTNQIATYTATYEAENDLTIDFSAELDIDIKSGEATVPKTITLSGNALVSEAYAKMEEAHKLEIEHISQFPELPSGDEVTALAMVLKNLGYKVDKCELCDLYLDKGPVGYTDFNKANVGNPRDTYNSYGCLPPVIINAATKFISANGGSYTAYDYSKRSVNELYYEVSQGNFPIVWACEDFDITPSISRIWIVDGQELYLKSNTACMVLCGYDFENNTVTLSSPAGGEFQIAMDLFEHRYLEMGAYAVVIK